MKRGGRTGSHARYVVAVPENSRITDAVELAHGLRRLADLGVAPPGSDGGACEELFASLLHSDRTPRALGLRLRSAGLDRP
jgi:hypothetical protein